MAGLRIAAVVTVSNRRDLTLACLESLCAPALQRIPIRQPVSGARAVLVTCGLGVVLLELVIERPAGAAELVLASADDHWK